MAMVCIIWYLYVPSPGEEDVSQDDQTEQSVEPLGAPLVNPGRGVSHRDADNAEYDV